ncbi:MAG: glucose-1-phosphate cytidylyltransferase [SAR116 cluster bacterium]|nr:glucose-1-phosphate cytidylyltransferase [SAR116 cluster bacterium]RPH08174.1 MAG: glucose-1-phosphate cytidylyltransferase [Alphaproteobacteria bacterium TMED54]
MKVVILAGGFGTRIKDVDENVPKPMLKIGNYPIIWHIMKYFSSFGFNEFILCLGFKGNVIRDFFYNYHLYVNDVTLKLGDKASLDKLYNKVKENWEITLVDTGIDNMTGSRISQIREYIKDENFFITYGDGVGNIDLKLLTQFHKKHKKILTVTGVRPPGRFGEIRSSNNIITEFNEKPQTTSGRISGGYFVANKKLFDFLDNDNNLVFEDKPINELVFQKQLMVFNHDGFWHPMDTRREHQILNDLYSRKKAPWVKWKY